MTSLDQCWDRYNLQLVLLLWRALIDTPRKQKYRTRRMKEGGEESQKGDSKSATGENH